jgi:hypothetical protein
MNKNEVSSLVMSRSKILFSSLLVLAATAITPAARAGSLYTFSFDGGGLSASGVLEVSPVAVPGVPGALQITGISGTFSDTNLGLLDAEITGVQATSLPSNINPDGTFLPPGANSDGFGFSYDNMFFAGADSPAVCPPPLPGDPHPPYPFGGGLFDIYGLLFNVDGGYVVDLWSNGVIPGIGLTYGAGDALNGVVLNSFGEPFDGTSVNAVAAAAPEPGSLLLLGAGLLGFAASRRLNSKAPAAK